MRIFVTRPKAQELPSSEGNSCSHQNVLVKFIRLYWSSVYAWLLVFKLNGKVRITNYSDAGITYNWVVFNSVLLFFVSIVQSNSSTRLKILNSSHRWRFFQVPIDFKFKRILLKERLI